MLRAMPSDGQPPLQYLLTHISLRLLGESAFALRVPEIIATITAGWMTYKIVRRHGTAIQALFALVMMLGAILIMYQAYTARPYGLLLAFTALTFYSWQTASLRQHHRLLPLCGVAMGIAGAILSHHFGLVHVGLFLAAGEGARFIQRHRLDVWLLSAMVTGLAPLALTLPLAHISHTVLGEAVLHSTNFWAKPSAIDLLWYSGMISLPLLYLFAIFAFLPWPKRPDDGKISSLLQVPSASCCDLADGIQDRQLSTQIRHQHVPWTGTVQWLGIAALCAPADQYSATSCSQQCLLSSAYGNDVIP
jgi:4-amino-4-deoxy-L-arabinose transferase-like glycosyltransferase